MVYLNLLQLWLKKRLKLIITLTAIFFFQMPLFSQTISNVHSEINADIITIHYSLLSAKFNQKFDVSLFVSFDGGKTFQGPMKTVRGDVGTNVKSGTNKIYWNPYSDVNSLDGDIVFDVRAIIMEEKVKRHFFIHYTGNYSFQNKNYSAPMGISIGIIGKVGFYLSGRINSDGLKSAQYKYDGKDIANYDKVLYYEFDNKYLYPSLEITGGLTFQLGWNANMYIGMGYGYHKYFFQINEYNYATNNIESKSYVEYSEYTKSGIDAEIGLIFRAHAVSFSIGCSTLKFNCSNIVFGIGVNI